MSYQMIGGIENMKVLGSILYCNVSDRSQNIFRIRSQTSRNSPFPIRNQFLYCKTYSEFKSKYDFCKIEQNFAEPYNFLQKSAKP